MRQVLRFAAAEVLPERGAILGAQGVPHGREVSSGVEAALDSARELFLRHAHPAAVLAAIDRERFAAVFAGEGRNNSRTPVGDVYPRAERMALFAATLGEEISAAITGLFAARELALAYMLDAAASEGAEATVARAAAQVFGEGAVRGLNGSHALPYSPGYCGWHLTGQRRLLAKLGVGEIGIRLNEQCLMLPLKSISGVILCGPREIHRFEPAYPCCYRCTGQQCRERIEW
ncbi:MAG: hypothetical protein KBD01_04810 [Acidobacteria bacterium]|nr:hypothetical protein [Acidobacteriota bacterium]